MNQITLNNVSIGVDKKILIPDLSMKVDEGDCLYILGYNGSGKTTLMKTILGILPPMEGRIQLNEELKKKGIGYIPQDIDNLKEVPASVKEVVYSGCQNELKRRFFYNKEDRKKVDEALKEMDVEHLKNECFRDLSGGQKRRVLLARTLCATKSMIMMDEPVTGLDPSSTNQMYAMVEELNKKGVSIICISHDYRAAMKYASHILQIDEDGSYFYGTKEEYRTNPKFRKFVGGGKICRPSLKN